MKERNMTPPCSLCKKTIQYRNNGFVSAVVINKVDLTLSLRIQNLINYFVDCLNSLQKNSPNAIVNLLICIKHIKKVMDAEKDNFDGELKKLIQEFMEAVYTFENLVNSYVETNRTNDRLVNILLSAKTSNLQWLSVCILTELQGIFLRI